MALTTIAVAMGMLKQNLPVRRRYENILRSTKLPISMLRYMVDVLNI